MLIISNKSSTFSPWLLRWPFLIISAPAVFLWTGWIVYRHYLIISQPYGHFVSIFLQLLAASPRLFAQGLGRNAAILATYWLIAVQIGHLILSLLKIRSASRAEEFLFSGGLGTGCLSLLLFGLGVCGLWKPYLLSTLFWAGALLSLAGLVIEIRNRKTLQSNSRRKDATTQPRWQVLELAAVLTLACAVVMTLLGTAAPEIFYDSLLYHLGLPKLYLINHRIVETPYNAYSGAPQAIQMLYGLMLSLGDERLTALLNWSLAVATALALFHFCLTGASRKAGIMAALLFFMAPVTLYAASCSGADIGAAFFCTLAFFALLRMSEDVSGPVRPRWPVCAGILLGLAMGSEYNVFPIAAVLAVAASFLGGERRIRDAAWVAAVAFLVLAPWLCKSVAFFGNPFYPIFHFFQREDLGRTDLAGLIGVARPRNLSSFLAIGGWRDFLQFPWTISETPMTMDTWPGPALLLLLPWIAMSRWTGAQKRAAFYALGAYLGWSVPNTEGRFIMPALPLMAYVVSLGVNNSPKWLRYLGWTGAVAVCAINFQAECHQGVVTQRWTSLAQGQSKADFLNQEHLTYPLPSYSAIEFINKNLPPEAKVLFLGDGRGFYCDRNFVAAGVYNSNPLWDIVEHAGSGAEIQKALAQQGITHIFLNAKGLVWATSDKLFPKTAIQAEPFADFWSRYLDLLYADNDLAKPNPKWLFVYSLRASPKERNDPGFLNPPRMVAQALAAR